MTRTWLSEFNLSVDRFTGYLNDPYKITSIIDSAGNTTGYVYESRPDQRTRKSGTGRIVSPGPHSCRRPSRCAI